MNARRITEALKQIPLQFVLLITGAIISIFVTMIPQIGYMGIIWFGKGLDTVEPVGIGYFIIGILGLITCAISCYIFMKRPGVDDAIIANMDEGEKAKFNFIYPTIIIIGSMILYFLINLVVDFQFLAGPVNFFAPYLGKLRPNGDFSEIDFIYKAISFGILFVVEVPAMYLGYIKGFKERMSGKQLL